MRKEKVQIQKFELPKNMEMLDFAGLVMSAVSEVSRRENKDLGLIGIFSDHIVVQDWSTGENFKLDLTVSGSNVTLGDKLVPVQKVFVPIKKRINKSSDAMQIINLPPVVVQVEKGKLTPESIAVIEKIASGTLPSVDHVDLDAIEKRESSVSWEGIF